MNTICAILLSLICSVYSTPTNVQLVEQYCYENYPECEIVYYMYDEYDEEVITNRANTGKVYVEIFISYADGHHGWSKEGYYIAYNKEVEKGEVVISYFIYNPYSNYYDDIVAGIDNGIVR